MEVIGRQVKKKHGKIQWRRSKKLRAVHARRVPAESTFQEAVVPPRRCPIQSIVRTGTESAAVCYARSIGQANNRGTPRILEERSWRLYNINWRSIHRALAPPRTGEVGLASNRRKRRAKQREQKSRTVPRLDITGGTTTYPTRTGQAHGA